MRNLTDGTLLSLQWLRAMAALGVVLYHLDMGINVYRSGRSTTTVFGAGGLGVVLFFVLSGFVISLAAAARPRNRGDFLVARLARIYPAYLATAGLVVLALALVPQGALNHTADISWARVLKTLVFDFGQMGGFVYVGWTLYYELGFYLLFSAVVPHFDQLHRRTWFQWLVTTALLICAGTGSARIGSFLLGMALFLVIESVSQGVRKPWSGLLLIAALLFGLRCPEPLVCAVLIGSLVMLERAAGWSFRWSPMLRLGEASYSIYLVQVLTNSASLKLAQRLSAGGNSFAPLALMLGVAGSVAGGLAMRRWIEKPGTTFSQRWRQRLLIGADPRRD